MTRLITFQLIATAEFINKVIELKGHKKASDVLDENNVYRGKYNWICIWKQFPEDARLDNSLI